VDDNFNYERIEDERGKNKEEDNVLTFNNSKS
jgi:hypothetical protein